MKKIALIAFFASLLLAWGCKAEKAGPPENGKTHPQTGNRNDLPIDGEDQGVLEGRENEKGSDSEDDPENENN